MWKKVCDETKKFDTHQATRTLRTEVRKKPDHIINLVHTTIVELSFMVTTPNIYNGVIDPFCLI